MATSGYGQTAFDADRETLISILNFVRDVLEELVEFRVREDRELFQSAWFNEVKPRLEELIRELVEMNSEDDPKWRQYVAHGLTGIQAKLKKRRLFSAWSTRIPKKILGIVNTILSSIPGADPVREFKELVEDGIEGSDEPIDTKFKE
jgi:hypothetical protein